MQSVVQQQINRNSLEYYFNNDFPNTLRIEPNSPLVEIDDSGNKKPVAKMKVYQDFNSLSKFIGFYIPYSEDTFGICVSLINNCQNMVDSLCATSPQSARQTLGSIESVKGEELRFTGMVYIYHQAELSHKQIAELQTIAESKNYRLEFRGGNYTTASYFRDKANGKINDKAESVSFNYSRFINDGITKGYGIIKAHRLAAYIAGIEPAGNISAPE